jgi:TetR/AcrR family transcriptional regulator, regulator of biofilm formation and stress response
MGVVAAGVDTRERILRETLDLIGREGIGAVTNRRVANAAGISLGSLTYHFASQSELLRETFLLFVSEEVVRLERIGEGIRRRAPDAERAARDVERAVREAGIRLQQLAEIELHLAAARDPVLRDASRRCFEAYEELAEGSLEVLEVPDAGRHARTIVATMYGFAVRRLGTGDEDPSGMAEALLTIVRGARLAG